MPAFNGRLTYEGDVDIATSMIPFAIQCAHIHSTTAISGPSLQKQVFPHANGGRIISMRSGEAVSLHIIPPTYDSSEFNIPLLDYYSGVVSGGMLAKANNVDPDDADAGVDEKKPKTAKLYSFFPTKYCADKYDLTKWASTQPTKLAVEMDMDVFGDTLSFNDLGGLIGGPVLSQYRIKPSLFTGHMRAVAQFVMGIGKVAMPTWHGQHVQPKWRGEKPEAPDVWEKATSKDYLEATTGYPKGATLLYDYRFENAHGIIRIKPKEGVDVSGLDKEGYRWILIRISKALGVLAMELPLDPSSVREEFYSAVEALTKPHPQTGKIRAEEAKEDLAILDKFGGFPNGVPMPKQVEAYIRAGVITRLLAASDMEDYTSADVWTSQITWAFSYTDSVAKVVCHEYEQLGPTGTGRYYAHCKKRVLTLRMNVDYNEDVNKITPSPTVTAYVAAAIEAAQKPWLAIKLTRLTKEDVATLEDMVRQRPHTDTIINALEMMQGVPVLTGGATMTTGDKQTVWPIPTTFLSPEPMFDLVISLFNTDVLQASAGYPMVKEGESTCIHVFFQPDGKEVPVYFVVGRPYVGSGTETGGGGQGSNTGCYYSKLRNDIRTSYMKEKPSRYPRVTPDRDKRHSRFLQVSAANDVTPELCIANFWCLVAYFNSPEPVDSNGTIMVSDSGTNEKQAICLPLGDNEAVYESTHSTFSDLKKEFTITYDAQVYTHPVAMGFKALESGTGPNGQPTVLLMTGHPRAQWNDHDGAMWKAAGGWDAIPKEWRWPWADDNELIRVYNGYSAEDEANKLYDAEPPDVPPPEVQQGRSSLTEMYTVRSFVGGEEAVYTSVVAIVDGETTTTFAPELSGEEDAGFDRSMYDPPEEAVPPIYERYCVATANALGAEGVSVRMTGISTYQHKTTGSIEKKDFVADAAVFVGYVE